MSSTPKDLIARRAYEIWETEGRPDGRDAEHWLRAEEELAEQELEAQSAPVRAFAAGGKAARKAAAADNRPARVTRGTKQPSVRR